MARCRIPVVAAVNGPAVGLGCSLVALSDIVYIAEGAYLADPHVQVGLVAADGGPLTWPLHISLLLAKEFALTAPAFARSGRSNSGWPTTWLPIRLAKPSPARKRSWSSRNRRWRAPSGCSTFTWNAPSSPAWTMPSRREPVVPDRGLPANVAKFTEQELARRVCCAPSRCRAAAGSLASLRSNRCGSSMNGR